MRSILELAQYVPDGVRPIDDPARRAAVAAALSAAISSGDLDDPWWAENDAPPVDVRLAAVYQRKQELQGDRLDPSLSRNPSYRSHDGSSDKYIYVQVAALIDIDQLPDPLAAVVEAERAHDKAAARAKVEADLAQIEAEERAMSASLEARKKALLDQRAALDEEEK